MRRLSPARIVAALVLIASPAAAQPNTDPNAVQAGQYRVEPTHTRVLFKVSHMGLTNWYGDFTGVSGTASFDPRNPSADRVDVSLPIASLSTTNATLDAELKGGGWFDAARFPTARFVSRRVSPTGPGQADLDGELTLHGVTRPVTLHVTFNGAGVNPMSRAYSVGFDARGVIQRSAFGIDKYVPMVGDQVELIISGGFEKTGG